MQLNTDTTQAHGNAVYIINLSTIHALAPLSTVRDNFAKLHYDYANSWLHFEWYSKLWTSYHYLKMLAPINDYKLGKIDTDGFIRKLQEIFYFLPMTESVDLLKNTWNSLIVWDAQATQRLNYLLEKNQPINLISNTNELNIQKIKQDINSATEKTWDWQKQTEGECHLQVYENFRLMTSYENGIFKTEGLLENWVTQLVAEGHNREDITLVSQYQADLDKANALGIYSQRPSQFFPAIASAFIEKSLPNFQAPTIAVANNPNSSRKSQTRFYVENITDNQEQNDDSETPPLLFKP